MFFSVFNAIYVFISVALFSFLCVHVLCCCPLFSVLCLHLSVAALMANKDIYNNNFIVQQATSATSQLRHSSLCISLLSAL